MAFNGTHFVPNTGAADNTLTWGKRETLPSPPTRCVARTHMVAPSSVRLSMGGPSQWPLTTFQRDILGLLCPRPPVCPRACRTTTPYNTLRPSLSWDMAPSQSSDLLLWSQTWTTWATEWLTNAAPANVNQQLGPVQQVEGQPQVIDLTGDDEPVPAIPAATPARQRAGAKRASPDSTTGGSAPKAKKPRFGKIVPTDLPSLAAQEVPAALPTPPAKFLLVAREPTLRTFLAAFTKPLWQSPSILSLQKAPKALLQMVARRRMPSSRQLSTTRSARGL